MTATALMQGSVALLWLWSHYSDLFSRTSFTWLHTPRASSTVCLCNSSCCYDDYHQIVKRKQHKLLKKKTEFLCKTQPMRLAFSPTRVLNLNERVELPLATAAAVCTRPCMTPRSAARAASWSSPRFHSHSSPVRFRLQTEKSVFLLVFS